MYPRTTKVLVVDATLFEDEVKGEFTKKMSEHLQKGFKPQAPYTFFPVTVANRDQLGRTGRTLPGDDAMDRVLVLALDPGENLEKQNAVFKQIISYVGTGAYGEIKKIVLALPEHSRIPRTRVAALAKDLGLPEGNVAYSPQEAAHCISAPNRNDIFKQYIKNNVISILQNEMERLKTKYDLVVDMSADKKNGEFPLIFNSFVLSKDERKPEDRSKNTSRSVETKAQRENAKERCAALQKTIHALNQKLSQLPKKEISDDQLESILASFKTPIDENIENFDKRKGGAANWGKKMGRRILNGLVLITTVIGVPFAIEYVKKKVVNSPETSNWNTFGKKLGLTETGKWFRVQGKTSLEGEKASKNLDNAFTAITKKKPGQP